MVIVPAETSTSPRYILCVSGMGGLEGKKNEQQKTQARVIEEDGFPFDYGSNFQTAPPVVRLRGGIEDVWFRKHKKKRASSVIDLMRGGTMV